MNAFKKWWVKLLIVIAVVIMVVAVGFCIAGVHSKGAVDRFSDQLRAAGEKLNIADLAPPPVKPESNGAEFFSQLGSLAGTGMLESNDPPSMRMILPGKAMVGWQQNEIVRIYDDFATNTWQDLDDALQPKAYAFDLLHKTVTRPELDFGEDYQTAPEIIQTEPLIKMKSAALLILPAVISDLHRGYSGSAVTNLHTLLMLVNLWHDPKMLSQLSRVAIGAIACAAQWEVLQATNLADSQLALLQRDWGKMDLTQSFEKSLEMERNFRFVEIEHMRSSNSPTEVAANWFSASAGSTAGSGSWCDYLSALGQDIRRSAADTVWRSVWSYEDQFRALQVDQAMVEALRRVNRDGYFKDAQADLEAKFTVFSFESTNFSRLRKILDTNIWSTLQHSTDLNYRDVSVILRAEVSRKVTLTAIALKRYQLRHGSWPPNLQALVPEFLSEVPRDPVDGKPLRYHPNPDGTFLLYSIGADGKDDGGDVTPGVSYKAAYWLKCPDWVWPQPATPAEVQSYYDHPPK